MAREARCRRVGLGREIARLTRVGPTWNLSAGRPESRLARGVIPLLVAAFFFWAVVALLAYAVLR